MKNKTSIKFCFIFLFLLTSLGIYFGFKLPISLFPNATRPSVLISFSHVDISSNYFYREYGKEIESKVYSIDNKEVKVKNLKIHAGTQSTNFLITFDWGNDEKQVKLVTDRAVQNVLPKLPLKIRDSYKISSFYPNGAPGSVIISFFVLTGY